MTQDRADCLAKVGVAGRIPSSAPRSDGVSTSEALTRVTPGRAPVVSDKDPGEPEHENRPSSERVSRSRARPRGRSRPRRSRTRGPRRRTRPRSSAYVGPQGVPGRSRVARHHRQCDRWHFVADGVPGSAILRLSPAEGPRDAGYDSIRPIDLGFERELIGQHVGPFDAAAFDYYNLQQTTAAGDWIHTFGISPGYETDALMRENRVRA